MWLTRNVRRKPAKERLDRSNLEMVVAVPWRKAKMDGERLKSDVAIKDKVHRERVEMEEHVRAPRRVCISRENLEEFGFTVRCHGMCVVASGNDKTNAHGKLSLSGLWELKGTANSDAAMRRMKECPDRAIAKGTKRTRKTGTNTTPMNRQFGRKKMHRP